MAISRKYVIGFPLLIMLSIRSREGMVTVFEIENDLDDTTGIRPASGSVYSALARMGLHRQVVQCIEEIEGRETYVYSLTETGLALVTAQLQIIDELKEIKPKERRGPRVSSAARRRRRCRPAAKPARRPSRKKGGGE